MHLSHSHFEPSPMNKNGLIISPPRPLPKGRRAGRPVYGDPWSLPSPTSQAIQPTHTGYRRTLVRPRLCVVQSGYPEAQGGRTLSSARPFDIHRVPRSPLIQASSWPLINIVRIPRIIGRHLLGTWAGAPRPPTHLRYRRERESHSLGLDGPNGRVANPLSLLLTSALCARLYSIEYSTKPNHEYSGRPALLTPNVWVPKGPNLEYGSAYFQILKSG